MDADAHQATATAQLSTVRPLRRGLCAHLRRKHCGFMRVTGRRS